MITSHQRESRMRRLIELLNDAREAYASGESLISDKQYDAYMYELETLEATTGIRFPNSPTFMVGYKEPEAKIVHYAPMLSLKATKDIDDLLHFLGEEDGLLSWKLDGVSIILYYKDNKLEYALTRGDGHSGKDITRNVLQMQNVLPEIPMKHRLILRGEGCVSLSDFESLKQTAEGEHYSNARSLAAGLVNRSKTSSSFTSRMRFIPHTVVHLEDDDHFPTRHKQLEYMQILGFEVVPHVLVTNYKLRGEIERYTDMVDDFDFPVDGLVLCIDGIVRGDSRGSTAKYPKHSMAYKWPDVTALTKVVGMKWSLSETGLLTPVVIVEPTQLEGTVVQQASLYNLKRFEDLGLGIGDTLRIYKANKIIPTVEDNLTRSGTERYPQTCPHCGCPTYAVTTTLTKKLYCLRCKQKGV